MDVSRFFCSVLGLVIMWLFVILIIVCWWSIRWRRSTLPPMYPGALPIVGHTLKVLMQGRDIWTFFKNAMLFALNNGKDACTITIGQMSLHVFTNPEDCYTVANTCIEKNNIYRFAKSWLGEGLITGIGSVWKQHRKLLNPALNQQVLDGFLEVFNKESRNLANSLREKTGNVPFDHLPYVQKWSLVTVCSTTMGFHDNEDSSDLFKEYISILHVLFDCMIQRLRKFWLQSDYLFKWSSLKRQQDKALNRINKLSNQIISRKEIEMQNKMKDNAINGKPKFKVYIELLIELKMNNVLTNEEVKEETDTLIAAGYDTTSLTVAQILIVLGSYPEVQEKVYQELQEIFGGDNRDVLKQDLSQIKYLEAVIKESMRLYPVVPIIVRRLDKTLNIKDYILPAGDDFMIPIYAINRHSVWGPDAEVFRPERWLNSNTLPVKAYSFASFSMGRRNCIGINYAMMSMKTALVHVLRQFKINSDINNIKYEFLLTLVPVSGYHITLEKR